MSGASFLVVLNIAALTHQRAEMNRFVVIVLLFLATISATPAVVGSSQIDPTWVAQAQTDIPRSVARYSALCKEMDEETVLKYQGQRMQATGGKASFRNRTINFSLQCLGGNVLLKTTSRFEDEPGKSTIVLKCRNEEYSFSLTQRTPDAPYILVKYNRDTPGDDVRVEGGFVSTAFQDLPIILHAIKSENGHKLTALRWDATKELLVAELEITTPGEATAKSEKREYRIDINNYWHIVERTIRVPSTSVNTVVAYGNNLDGLALPSEIIETSSPVNSETVRVEMNLSLKKTSKRPEDFRLAAFGLPEPVDVPQRQQTPIYLWFVLGAVICGMLALLLRYRARRAFGERT